MTTTASHSTSPSRLAAVVVAAMTASVLPVFMVGALAVQIRRDLDLTDQALGLAIGSYFLVATVTSISLGKVTDRFGWRRGLRAMGVLSAVASMGIATLANSWPLLIMFLSVAGVAQAIGHPAGNLALATGIPERRKGLAFGVKQAAVPIATFSGGLAIPTLALTVGWRWAFAVAALFAVGAALMVPRNIDAGPPTRPNSTQRAHTRFLLLLAAAGACGAAAANSAAAFLTTATVDSGLSDSTAGKLLMIGSATALAMRLASGWIADRFGRGTFPMMTGMFLVGSLGIAMLATDSVTLLIIAVALAFGGAWGWTALFHFAIVTSNRGAPAAATGLSVIGLYIGATVGPPSFGILVSWTSFDVGWMIASLVALCGVGFLTAARRSLAHTGASSPQVHGDAGFSEPTEPVG